MPKPAYFDLSFQLNNVPIHFSITQHDNIDFVVFSSIGRVGQVIEVVFPEEIIAEALANHSRIEYETKVLLGSNECAQSDLFVRRLIIALASKRRCSKLIVNIGFDIDALKIEHITAAISKLEFVFKSTERSLLDQQLALAGGLNGLYEWQNKQQRNVFELLDGPPFANGVPHTGHAINKILKDFIVKSRIALGYKVRFRPGWDCHGLPIELKITKKVEGKSPVEIRQLSREVANEAIGKQMHGFKRWGVTADWSSPYLTMDKKYVAEELRLFGRLISKGLVYRSFKPVFWSASSRSALAESELEYNENHKSIAVYYRFKGINILPADLNVPPDPKGRPLLVYLTSWTTTPWTLPMNNAIAVSADAEYAAIQFEDEQKNPVVELYVVARELVKSFEDVTNRRVKIVGHFKSNNIIGKFYQNCWYNELALPIIASEHVTMSKGTGLVHTSYAHGHKDYSLAVERGDKVQSYVDENGCYTRHMGHDLDGKPVLGSGQKEVLNLLKKDIIYSEKYVHSYPYDWRTKQPIIIRSSAQWFIDVGKIAQTASSLLKNVQIGSGQSDFSSNLENMITTRPSWCISRQRAWGTPIPAIFGNKGETYFSEDLACRVAELVEKNGTDYWWTCSVEELLTPKVMKSLGIQKSDGLTKGNEILDVWIDSGMAWHCAKKDYDNADVNKPADVILEGVDQFRGWFQSLLLTSCAVNDSIPYNRVLVHGFCVDDNNKKMSKSIGNVVDPELVTDGSLRQKALGADGLRLWVALAGAESAAESRIGEKVLADIDKKIIMIRNSLRFLLGGCHGYEGKVPEKLPILDQYILKEVTSLAKRSIISLEQFKFRTVMNEILQFSQRELSANYVILRTPLSTKVLESLQFHPQLDKVMNIIMMLRTKFAEAAGPKAELNKLALDIHLLPEDKKVLEAVQETTGSFDSQLCELLGVSHITLSSGPDFHLQIVPSPGRHCERCRKLNRSPDTSHCSRCTQALANLV